MQTLTPVDVGARVWFNEDLESRNFIVPGIVALVMAIIGAQLTSLTIAREWERGTMEAMMATPISMAAPRPRRSHWPVPRLRDSIKMSCLL